jgi:hypothetical protein
MLSTASDRLAGVCAGLRADLVAHGDVLRPRFSTEPLGPKKEAR